VPVELIEQGERPRLTPGLDLVAFRVVQESLTNVRKHAPGATTRVQFRYGPNTLELEVVNESGATAADANGGRPAKTTRPSSRETPPRVGSRPTSAQPIVLNRHISTAHKVRLARICPYQRANDKAPRKPRRATQLPHCQRRGRSDLSGNTTSQRLWIDGMKDLRACKSAGFAG
jgi:hypothetical protein